ncbi:MAG: hypothetical protein WDO14_18090 [Bacteroidota bacterium]
MLNFPLIDSYLSEHYRVPASYFDDLLKQQQSSFLIGLKIFFNFYDLGVDKCEQILKVHSATLTSNDPFKSYLGIAQSAILFERRQVDEAISVIKRSIALESNNKWCHLQHYYLVSRTSLPETADVLSELVNKFPDWPWAKMERALSVHSALHGEDAASIIHSLPQTLRNEETEVFLGDVYFFDNDQHYRSFKHYQDSLKIKENSAAWCGLANYENYYNEDKVAATKCYQRAIEIDKSCTNAYATLGWFAFYDGDHQKALEFFEKSIEVETTVDNYWDLALFYIRTKNFPMAHKYVNEIKNHWGDTHDSAARILVVQLSEDDSARDQLIASYIDTYGPGSEEFLSGIMADANMEL